jgi:hypothetical protein
MEYDLMVSFSAIEMSGHFVFEKVTSRNAKRQINVLSDENPVQV